MIRKSHCSPALPDPDAPDVAVAFGPLAAQLNESQQPRTASGRPNLDRSIAEGWAALLTGVAIRVDQRRQTSSTVGVTWFNPGLPVQATIW
jgi:hypothetical protein